ncbi:MAG TPA: hypothetical protein VLA24_04435 [Pseudomonadales bacterium]|nr:hypothetical protein [Pseudomonadales bacterium]
MKITLAVDMGEGPFQVSTNLYVVVQYERKYKRKASDMANGVGAEDLLYLAYESCKVHGVVVPAVFDDFIKRCQSIEVVSEEPENPTQEPLTATH